jgi:hypothetical protein
MASAAFPSVVAAVFSVASTAMGGVRVTRGRDISAEAGDVVMVGIQNMDESGYDSAGTFQQTMQTFGGNREEVGTVNGLVLAWDGDSDQDMACSTAFAHLAALEAAVRADPKLGLTTFDYVLAEMQAGDVQESQDSDGASTTIAFAIAYKIRI